MFRLLVVVMNSGLPKQYLHVVYTPFCPHGNHLNVYRSYQYAKGNLNHYFLFTSECMALVKQGTLLIKKITIIFTGLSPTGKTEIVYVTPQPKLLNLENMFTDFSLTVETPVNTYSLDKYFSARWRYPV